MPNYQQLFHDDPVVSLSESQLCDLLSFRYTEPEYAFLRQVRSCSLSTARTADAIAMCLWPSRGLYIHGFECKTHKGDLKKELDTPEKAEEVACMCDFWWLVLGHKSLMDGLDIPVTWGIYAPTKNGNKLRKIKDPEKLEPQTLDREFLAAILRRVMNVLTPESKLKDMYDLGYEKGVKDGMKRQETMNIGDNNHRRHERLLKSVEDFEKLSGIQINEWNGGRVGEIVDKIFNHNLITNFAPQLRMLKNLRNMADRQISAIREVVSKMDMEPKDPL